ncbi:hypothetical protein [Streptomyces thinghirensis]|uniref:Uncharacterized protein n=1 Tax=Streptomyces thinghirensis TaxID=551547 RepID=A0ABP9TAM4_9ACTN
MSPHDWFFCRLPEAGSPELSELIRPFRTADGIWFFDPVTDASGRGVELWFRAAPGEIAAFRAALHTGGGLRVAEERIAERPPVHPGGRGLDIADELAAASSELALSLAAVGAPSPQDGPDWAVRHLRHIVGLVPQRERRAFLFACWQHWTTALKPAHRVDLGLQAEIAAASATPDVTGPAADPWVRYTTATRAVACAPGFTANAPGNYLLFDHAHRTHGRLGLSLAVEALAVRIVRAEYDATGAPVTPVPSVLQDA